MVGRTLGSYQVLDKLGEGGMGEVYRAKDSTLGRDVAIKVLPASVAQDPERLARFEREAKLLASLSHTNIAQVYGLEGTSPRFLVMELAPGDDLTLRISRGPMPLDEALPLATQIAQALEAAHERGIVHRDLKPANIKVSADGAVKVLDFGLAKALSPEGMSGSSEAMNSPTLTAQATAAGIILGTAAYMSPEQARGRDADKRADVWAFGVVLYEMLTGARLFHDETISDTLAAVLRQDIDLSRLPPGTPAELRRLLRRCLERDRKNRLHDIADARIAIQEIARGGDKDASAPPPGPVNTRARWLLAAGIGAAMLAIGVAAGRWTAPTAPSSSGGPAGTIRLVVPAPSGVTDVSFPAVAPDGSFVVFLGRTGPKTRQLYLHRFDEGVPRVLPRTEGALQPFISPDGRWIAFRRANRLEKIATDGGEPLQIADASIGGPGSTWLAGPPGAPVGPIVFGASWLGGLSAVSAEGGTVRALTTPDAARGEIGHFYPFALPGGRHVLFTVWLKTTGLNDAEVALVDVETGKHRILFKGAEAHYVAPGAIVFFRAGAYHAVRFDLETLTASGEPVRVIDDAIGNFPEAANTHMDLAPGGTLAYLNGAPVPESRLVWVSPGGKLEQLRFPARAYETLDLAPGGHRAAVGVLEAGRWVTRLLDLLQQTDDLLDLPGSNWKPTWHPDGKRLAVRSMRKGDFDIYWKDVTSTAPPAALLVTDRDETPSVFAPNGQTLVVEQSEPDGTYPLKTLSLMPPGQPLLLTPFETTSEAVSRDGKFIAVVSDRSGIDEVYILPLGGSAVPERVSVGGGRAVGWAENGRELYYARPPEIIAVTLREEGGRLRPAGERVWARVEHSDPKDIFAVGPDGRILIALPTTPLTRQIRVVLGWDKEIAAKLQQRK